MLGKFRKLTNCQSFALALTLMLMNQQVLSDVQGRRRYESAFENLFQKGRDAAQQLASFHLATKDDKDLQQNTDKVMAFVKANPDKAGVAVALVASSWLLYQSITLGEEVGRFFDDIVELKGQFDQFKNGKIPELEKEYAMVRDMADGTNPRLERKYFTKIYKELLCYYQDLQRIMDIVDDVMADVNNGKTDAVINIAVSGSIAIGSLVVLIVGGPTTMAPVFWNCGVAATLGLSSASTCLSLKNMDDLDKACLRLLDLQLILRKLRKHVLEKMMDIIQFV